MAQRTGVGRKAKGYRAPSELRSSTETAGHLVALVAKAFRTSELEVVDEIARMAAAPRAGESSITRETILSYIKDPAPAVVKQKTTVLRRNRLTPVHYRFAHLVINYLDGRRPDSKSVVPPANLVKSTAWQEAHRLCERVLRDERDRRFERSLGSDPGTQAAISALAGVYAVCRRESSDAQYHQEVLILRNSGTRMTPRCHCTYVTERAVTRGEWIIVGSMVHCNISGFREDNTHEVGGLYLSYYGSDLLSGFVAGSGTDMKLPVVMPMVAVKVSDADPSILEFGDHGDEAILRAFRTIGADLSGISETLSAILEREVQPAHFNPSACNSALRQAFDGGRTLIHDRTRAFFRSQMK